MKVLETQADFERLWFGESESEQWIVYFTADWCKACKKLNLEEISNAAKSKSIELFICDETLNNYTAGYCGIRKFPTFVCFEPKCIKNTIQSSDTSTVVSWILGQQ